MPSSRRLRVRVIVSDPPAARWHRSVLAAIQAEPVDLTTAAAGKGQSSDVDIAIDLVGESFGSGPGIDIWRYGFGDGGPAAGGARGTLARLYRVDPHSANAAIIREGWFRASSDEAPGIDDVGECVAPWCAQHLRQLQLGASTARSAPLASTAGCNARLPPMVHAGTAATLRETLRRWRRRERWTVGFVNADINTVLATSSLDEPRWLNGIPAGSYFADPFPIAADGDMVSLAVEEYRYKTGRGRLVHVEAGLDGSIHDTHVIAEGADHLAYPFVLRSGDRMWCVPDASGTGQACAFRLDAPLERTVLLREFAAVDPTLVQHAGRWWMFCTPRGPLNQTDLYIFEAPAWQGPWRPHPLNPVKSDARSSRPAGACFARNGELFRPAQDCSRRYGAGVAINRVIELSPTAFREETIATLAPQPSWQWPDGLHTFNAIGNLVVVDALRVERS